MAVACNWSFGVSLWWHEVLVHLQWHVPCHRTVPKSIPVHAQVHASCRVLCDNNPFVPVPCIRSKYNMLIGMIIPYSRSLISFESADLYIDVSSAAYIVVRGSSEVSYGRNPTYTRQLRILRATSRCVSPFLEPDLGRTE